MKLFQTVLSIIFVTSFSTEISSNRTKNIECTFARYIDSKNTTSNEVMSPSFQSNFSESNKKLAAGYTRNHFWIKVLCHNKTNTLQKIAIELDYPLLQLVDIYFSDNSKPDYSLGKKNLQASKFNPIENRFPLAFLDLEKNNSQPFFFHIASTGPVIGSINVYDLESFAEKEIKDELVVGLYFGLFLANIILIIFLITTAFSTRQKSDALLFSIYLLYVLANTLYQLSYTGLAHLYLWPENHPISYRSVLTLSPILILFLNEYGRKFLNLKVLSPKLNLFLIFISIANILLIPFCYFGDMTTYGKLISQTSFLFLAFYFLYSFYLVLKRTPNSLLFFLGWAFYLLGVATLILRNFNTIPYNFFTKHAQEIGTIIEMFFFSISLVYRMRIKHREMIKSSAVLQTTSAVSHEIKRPFKVVLSEIKSLQIKHPELVSELNVNTIPIINSAFDRLNNLIQEYRLINEPRSHLKKEKVDLLATAKEAAKNVQRCFSNYIGTITFNGHSTTIPGLKTNFLKIFENIFENAIEAGGNHTIVVFKISKTFLGGTRIKISNSDSTIAKNIHDQIFTFYTTTKSEGHGIGLALCHKLITDYGGSINAQSDYKGNSTTFSITLPRR